MAEPTTTLSAAITSTSATSISVTSAAGFPGTPATNSATSGDYRITIDSEDMLVTAGNGTTTWTVSRGYNGTTAATHLINATVTGYIAVTPLADTSRRQVVVGAAASGSALAGNPVLVAGSDGTDARSLATDTSGRAEIVGAAAAGSAVAGNPVLVGGSDGTDARTIATDASGDVKIVQGGVTDGAGTYASVRLPNVFHTAQATASGNTAVWTPTSGKKFRLLRYQVEMTENATLGTAAVLTISFQDATTAIPIAHDVWVPSAAGTSIGDGYSSGWIDLGGLGVLSATANNVLNVNLSAAVTAGNVRVNVAGTEE